MRWIQAALLLAACAHPPAAPPPAPPAAAPVAPPAPPPEKPAEPAPEPAPVWSCVDGTLMRVVTGQLQCASNDGTNCVKKDCAPAPKTVTCTPDLYWSENFSINKDKTWCDIGCEKVPGCIKPTQQQITVAVIGEVQKQEEEHQRLVEETEKTMPPSQKQHGVPPPDRIDGQSPCVHDSDCSMQSTRSCCGCEGITVASTRFKPKPAPACGCGNFGNEQALAALTGVPGRCGFPPPPATLYQPVCQKGQCVGIKK